MATARSFFLLNEYTMPYMVPFFVSWISGTSVVPYFALTRSLQYLFIKTHIVVTTSVYAPGPLALINAIIFVRVQDAFLYTLYYGLLKRMLQSQPSKWKISTLICVHLIHFPFLYFQWNKSVMWKKLNTCFFIPNQSRTKGMQSCVRCGTGST